MHLFGTCLDYPVKNPQLRSGENEIHVVDSPAEIGATMARALGVNA
ncbi:hypothetical protein J2X69_001354 [Algoriphagus sp. 4150]|nr:hypothetical protein [Algoriphagus sp. 4150]MDR7129019.1 hypothetical protein [Algoriphagus sp. 4150]